MFLTATAMTAFAANSLLCRMALGAESMDAASFTTGDLAIAAPTDGSIAATSVTKENRTNRVNY